MGKIERTVLRETRIIAVGVLILSALMQACLLYLHHMNWFSWDYTSLLGNLLGGLTAVGNFFLLGLGVQKAVSQDEKQARATVKLSQTYRFLLLIVIAVIGAVVPCFNIWATVIPFLFPRMVIGARPLWDKQYRDDVRREKTAVAPTVPEDEDDEDED